MKRSIFSFRNEDGSALIIVVLTLLLGTLIGICATITSTIEIQISGNDKFHKIAFYGADSGVYTVPKLISPIIDVTDAFYKKLAFGKTPYPHIKFDVGNDNHVVEVIVEKLRSTNLVGGGVEFAAASEGAGVGGLKGIFYGLDSFCTRLQNTRSNVGAQYLKVTSAAGGM
jgi:hypothetical protein